VSILEQLAHSEVRRETGSQQRKIQLVELLVFLLLIVPSLAMSLVIRQLPQDITFPLAAVNIMLRDLSLLALIFYFLWRNGEPIRRIGWRFERIGREFLVGVLLFPPFLLFNMGTSHLLLRLGLTGEQPNASSVLQPHGIAQLVLAVVLVVVVAITEETIFRGYLLLRMSAISRSTVVAAIVSSLIFAIGHGYEGMAGVATVAMMGMIFAWVYLWRGSLVAPMTMHFLQDFVVIVIFTAAASWYGGGVTQIVGPVPQRRLDHFHSADFIPTSPATKQNG